MGNNIKYLSCRSCHNTILLHCRSKLLSLIISIQRIVTGIVFLTIVCVGGWAVVYASVVSLVSLVLESV